MKENKPIQFTATQNGGMYWFVFFFLFATVLFATEEVSAQNCSSNTPTYNINMTGKPDSIWTSPAVGRSGQCCNVSSPDVCILFNVTLDTNASGVIVEVSGGTGTTDYQSSCGNTTPVGSMMCLSGAGPHHLTICKPGGNNQVYKITSIPRAHAPIKVVYITQDCFAKLAVIGMKESTISWTAIQGTQYNSNLSCTTGCDTTIVKAGSNFPSYLDFKVCGTPNNPCFTSTVCDTVRVYFLPRLSVSISPKNGAICDGNNAIQITATGTGGKTPYKFEWNTSAKTTSITATPGKYYVKLVDALGCYIATDTVEVKKYSNPTPEISGDSISCKLSRNNVYKVTNNSGSTFSWAITGGTIVSGENSDMIIVNWGNTNQGSLEVTETITATGCIGKDIYQVLLNNKPVKKAILK